MEAFFTNIFSYPTLFFTVLLIIVQIYWLFAILGMLEIDILDIGPDLAEDAGDGLQGLGGLMVMLGLSGVPVTVVVSLLVLSGWLYTFLAVELFFFWTLDGWWNVLAGTGVLLVTTALSIPTTALLSRPLRGLFAKAYSTSPQKVLIGQTCVVRSGTVNETFGEVTAVVDGASLLLKVRADASKQIKRGDRVVLLEYQAPTNTYWVIPEQEFIAGGTAGDESERTAP